MLYWHKPSQKCSKTLCDSAPSSSNDGKAIAVPPMPVAGEMPARSGKYGPDSGKWEGREGMKWGRVNMATVQRGWIRLNKRRDQQCGCALYPNPCPRSDSLTWINADLSQLYSLHSLYCTCWGLLQGNETNVPVSECDFLYAKLPCEMQPKLCC